MRSRSLAFLACPTSLGLLLACQSPNPSRVAPDAEVADARGDDAAGGGPGCAAGEACDDSDPCTVGDTCREGRCEGTARDCTDSDPCTLDMCDLATGECRHESSPGAPEGPPGDPTCGDGLDQDCDGDADADDADCRACQQVADCPQADPCVTVKCEAGRCVETPTGEGQSCDSGDPCREKGLCTSGRCEAAERACPSPDPENPCLRGACLPESGECASAFADDGTPCDDGDPCTGEDACTVGVCGGAPVQCGGLDAVCVVGICDPETGGCRAQTVPDGTPCGGQDLCLPAGTCTDGRCSGAPVDCTVLDGTCRVGVCDPETGGCSAVPAADAAGCDDGDPCTFQDTCAAGACVGLPLDCAVLDSACQAGRCDPATGACAAVPAPNGTPCDDETACTEADACREGLCQGVARVCEGGDACRAAACDEASGECVLAPVADGLPCDDGDRCTGADTCAAGACQGAPNACAPPSACFVGRCDPLNGACSFERILRPEPEGAPGDAACADGTDDDCDGLVDAADPDCRVCVADADCAADFACAAFACVAGRCTTDYAARDGTACDDGNPCTTGDACAAGRCAASPLDCTAFDSPCTAGRCDPAAGGCVADARPEGAACDDGDDCTLGDMCAGGLCGGSARDCTGLDGECVVGACDPATGGCVTAPRGDGAPCADGDPCTEADACTGGLCRGTAVACEAGPCEVGVCDPASGACHTRPAEDGTACDDADPCTTGDTCRAGACSGAPMDCAAYGGPCVTGVCDAAAGGCRAVPVPDRTPCDDGSLCTADEACVGGECLGTMPDCSALDGDCRQGACDPATGRCAAVAVADGGLCDDGNACTQNDACAAGDCAGVPVDCSPLTSLCSMGRCDPDSGACVSEPINDGARCDDGNTCTDHDACTDGQCVGAGLDCSELSGPCTVGQCDAQGRCTAVPVADATPCTTADLCLVEAACRAGVCVGSPRDCSAQDGPCGTGVCDPRNGACVATPAPDGQSCDDQDACTTGETCTAGRCEGGPRDCSGLDAACAVGACDPALPDGCHATPRPDGVACQTGNRCVDAEACRGGACVGTPKACPAPQPGSCRISTCDPQTGACGFTDAPDGTACDDGRYCTVGETCTRGQCGGGGPRNCNPAGEPCRAGTCDENNDRCNVQNRQNGTACDDGQYCTTSDACWDGVCRPRGLRFCPDANAGCRVGYCDENTDRCDLRNALDYKPCLDGDLCTVGDHCEVGACIPGARICN